MTESSQGQNNPGAENDSTKPKWWKRPFYWCGRKLRWIITGLNYCSPTLTALATALIGFVAILQWLTFEKTDETLKIQQRAWVSPIGAGLRINPPIKDDGISFALSFLNSGREPATGIKIKIENSTIDSYDPKFTDVSTITVPTNHSCVGLLPDVGRAIIPPTGNALAQISQNSIHGDPRMVTDDRIISGAKFYVVQGCAAYWTQNKIRHSSFCYILESYFQPPIPQRLFNFVTCATGFDAS